MSNEVSLPGHNQIKTISKEYIAQATTFLETLYSNGILKNEDIPVVIAETIKNTFSEARETYASLFSLQLTKEEHDAKIYREYGVTVDKETGVVTLNIGADSLMHHQIEESKANVELTHTKEEVAKEEHHAKIYRQYGVTVDKETGVVTLNIGADSLMHHQIEESISRQGKAETEIKIAERNHISKLYRDDGITIDPETEVVTLNIGADSVKHHQIELLRNQSLKSIEDTSFVKTQNTEMQEQVIDNRIIKIGEIYSDFIMALGNAGVEPNETLITNFLILTKLGLLRTGVHIDSESGAVTAQIEDYNGDDHIVELADYSLLNETTS